MKSVCRIFCVALLLAAFAGAGTVAAAAAPAPDPPAAPVPAWQADLTAARDAYARNDARTLDRLHERNNGALAGHPLEMYAQYWWLSAHLAQDSADRAEVARFLARNPDTRLAEQLRRDWLKQLGKAHDWEAFAAEYPKFTGDDQDIVCWSWQQRFEHGDRETLNDARSLWLSGRPAPEACDAMFGALIAANRVAPAEAWARVRRLLESGNVAEIRRIAAALPDVVKIADPQLNAANADPGRYLLREKIKPKSRASIELGLFAMERLARRDAPEAANWLDRNAAQLDPDDARYGWAQVGYYAAQQHEPRALEWFSRAGAYRLSDAQAAWKVRAALRLQDWAAVQSGIDAMAVLDQREPTWRYWRARALKAQGNKAAADAIFVALAAESNFYGLMAADEIGMLAAPKWDARPVSRADIDRVSARPALQRAFLLYQAGMPAEGLREWSAGMRGMDDTELIAAAAAANELGIPDRAMRAADRTVLTHDYTLRFPIPHRETLTLAAKQNQLDEAWVYGLIRQESAFISGVRSRVGATGLMQLMPSTAKWVARRASLKDFRMDRLADVDVNLALGTTYLRHVLDDLGDPVLATAAYNAGPGRARRWRADQPLEGAIYAESIPFEETRDYVKKVMANAYFYTSRLGMPRRSIKEMLGTVPGRFGAATVALAPTQAQPANAVNAPVNVAAPASVSSAAANVTQGVRPARPSAGADGAAPRTDAAADEGAARAAR